MNPGKLIILLLFTIGSLLYGEIYLDVENTSPQVGESFTMSVIMEKKERYNIENIENFRVISRYSASNTSFVNGKKSSRYTETYELLSLTDGIFSLKAVTKDKESNEVDIEVGGEPSQATPAKKYTIQISPSKNTYYFGEKIPYVESLITTISLQGIDYLERPDFGNLSVTDMNSGRIGSLQSRTTLEGNEAIDIVLYQGLLEPSSSGTRKIGGSIVRLALDGRDPFSRRTETIAGQLQEITILPLPAGAPQGFKNLVGSLYGENELNRTSVKKGEAATMSVKLSGSSDLTSLRDIVSKDNPDFNIYENTVSYDMRIEDRKFVNEKIFQIAFVPKNSGMFKTPKIEIPYFDTDKEKYAFVVIEPMDIEVTEDIGIVTSASTGAGTIEEVTISTLPLVVEGKNNNNLIVILLGLVIIQGGVIIYLLRDKFGITRKVDDPFKVLKRSRDDKEFYENYCVFMKERYNFNPKAHSSDRLEDTQIRNIHLEVERAKFSSSSIDRKNIIKKLEELS